MFVAPLNMDFFFKKVFSNITLAQHFLEDLLGVTITAIKFLSLENKVSDDAVTVKFDFRCKINKQYVVIEMQQTYKTDVIKRFYLYHSVSTALQLETLKPITIERQNGEKYAEKNYSGLEPVLTLIWMVDDTLGFEEDLVIFSTLPEATKDFITDSELWKHPRENLSNILAERKKVLKILENDTKGLDFFVQNKIIYIFQKNIIANKRINLPYYKWFDFAAKSKKANNTEADFENYKKDKDMAEVINRLRKDNLTTQEADFASSFLSFEIAFEQMRQENEADRQQMQKIERDIQKAERTIAKERQEKVKERAERIKAEQEKQLLQYKMINVLLKQNATLSEIAETLGLSLEQVTELIKKVS
ncbi:MAG: hypothetical protein HC817_07130 [Saprospiraceae bacterium]|nr:hypothetical protein [Saprospiraceae bacterium]